MAAVKLYVCYGTWTVGASLHAHPCGEAHRALVQAGYEPEVVRSYGLGLLPGAINDLTRGRREVKEMTGSYWVPLLLTGDGIAIHGAEKIIAWARTHAAHGGAA
ncbi:MAG: hypothetical protein ACR2NR_23245 [Solirubrobacteraceae bacterium]